MATLDIFNQDAFSLRSMTKAINKIPPRFSYLGQIPGLFEEVGSSTTNVMIEENEGKLALIPDSKRGTRGVSAAREKRKVRSFICGHKQVNDEVLADQVLGVRMFGSETEMDNVSRVVAERLQYAADSLDVTLEFMRLGAVKGIIMEPDETGAIVETRNLFEEFEQQQYKQTWNVSSTTSEGAIKKKCNQLIRRTIQTIGGDPVREFHILCGDDLFDAIENSLEVREANKWRNNSDFLVDSHAYRYFEYGGIKFVNYQGYVGSTQFIDAKKGYLLPIGVPNMFVVNYGPADYNESVGTVGIKYYAKQERLRFDKGIEIEAQTNPLVLCTRPAALCEITLGTAT